MTPIIFSKFKNYIYFPDFANKFLVSNRLSILSFKTHTVYLRYIFTNYYTYNPLIIKIFLMLESIYPKRCRSYSKLVILKFSKTRCHSTIYMELTLEEFIPFFAYYVKRPASITTVFNSFMKQHKYFAFPGFISRLWFPSWEQFAMISYKKNRLLKSYSFLVHKAAFLD